MTITRMRLVAAAGAVLVLAAGCGSGSSNSSVRTADKAGGAAQGGVPAADLNAKQQPPAAPAKLAPVNRSLIFTGTVTVRVSNVDDAVAKADQRATAAGGFVAGEDRTDDNDRSRATLTLRVPSERFAAVVDQLAAIGTPESRKLSTEDVTDQMVDLDARIRTGEASVARVRDLMGKAATITEIVSLESELSRREADLESLKSRKAKLDDSTTLSTITLTLLGPAAAVPTKSTGFLAGLSAGWRAFVVSMQVLLTVLGALLPWLVLLGVPAIALLLYLRRTRRRAPEPTA
jgi:hypothetical protein